MARSKTLSPRSVTLHSKVEVEVTEVPFTPFDSVRHLDVERLSRAASARFEVGYFDSGCCRRVAHAVVRKGVVTKLELEPCKKHFRATPEIKRVIQTARKQLAARRGGTTSLPVPVRTFLAGPIGPHFSMWGCMKLCCFGHCIICCFHIPGTGGGLIWVGCAIDTYPLP